MESADEVDCEDYDSEEEEPETKSAQVNLYEQKFKQVAHPNDKAASSADDAQDESECEEIEFIGGR